MSRLFFTIFPDPLEWRNFVEVQQKIASLLGDKGVRWEPASNLRITLKFLSEMFEAHILSVIKAGETVGRDIFAFDLTLNSLGFFRNKERLTIIWAKVGEGLPLLHRIAELLDSRLEERGCANEDRSYQPHLTLAKSKDCMIDFKLETLKSKLEKESKTVDKICIFRVSSFVLVRSDANSEDSKYSILKEFALRN